MYVNGYCSIDMCKMFNNYFQAAKLKYKIKCLFSSCKMYIAIIVSSYRKLVKAAVSYDIMLAKL